MNSRPENALKTFKPPVRRRRGPVVSGPYAKPKNPQRLRLPAVLKLINKTCEVMPWIRGEHLPTLRKWEEMEMIRLAMFSAITQAGITSVDRKTNDVSARRLVDDYRKLAMSQLVLERTLLMTPASRAQLSPAEQQTDLVAMMASASAAETVEPEEPPVEDPPDEEPPREDPVPPKESPTEPGQPAPMKADP